MSGGRFDLRTGTGASARWARPWWQPVGVTYPGRATRRAILDEWLRAVRQLWAEPGRPFAGAHLQFGEIRLDPAVERPPVTVAAVGPKAMEVAARHADVWEASYLTPDGFAALAARFGPPARPVIHSLEVDAVTAATELERRRLEQAFLAERGEAGPAALGQALTGPSERLAEQLAAYRAAGVDQVVVACVDPHNRSSLETLARAAALAGQP
jgi:alkanesulfonate monooxygenase SsuD/methylene tetrahydromethanopterin reductase-like flavin-dependent oxidoreductase (luciferase family)